MNKYRAWDKINKKMYQVYGWNTSTNEIYICSLPNSAFKDGALHTTHVITKPLDNFILMQSTGLKDKDGVETWEGNYLTREGCPSYVIERVEEYGCLMAVALDPIKKTNWKPKMVKELLEAYFVNDGNIHENPELLKEVE